MKEIFENKSAENCNSEQDMKDSHYYKWLESESPEDVHAIHTKRKYLESIGFNIDIHRVDKTYFDSLKAIESYYVHIVLKPIWDERLKAEENI